MAMLTKKKVPQENKAKMGFNMEVCFSAENLMPLSLIDCPSSRPRNHLAYATNLCWYTLANVQCRVRSPRFYFCLHCKVTLLEYLDKMCIVEIERMKFICSFKLLITIFLTLLCVCVCAHAHELKGRGIWKTRENLTFFSAPN